jgi:hypothetical protein
MRTHPIIRAAALGLAVAAVTMVLAVPASAQCYGNGVGDRTQLRDQDQDGTCVQVPDQVRLRDRACTPAQDRDRIGRSLGEPIRDRERVRDGVGDRLQDRVRDRLRLRTCLTTMTQEGFGPLQWVHWLGR